MRSVLDIVFFSLWFWQSALEHNENFSERRKGQVQLEFRQIFNDFRDLRRLWTTRDSCRQATQPLRF